MSHYKGKDTFVTSHSRLNEVGLSVNGYPLDYMLPDGRNCGEESTLVMTKRGKVRVETRTRPYEPPEPTNGDSWVFESMAGRPRKPGEVPARQQFALPGVKGRR